MSLDVDRFRQWAATALPGDTLTYHTGNLLAEVLREVQDAGFNVRTGRSGLMRRDQSRLGAIADEAMRRAVDGSVALFQRLDREGPRYEYLAVKLGPRTARKIAESRRVRG
jgi:hypothetical protein